MKNSSMYFSSKTLNINIEKYLNRREQNSGINQNFLEKYSLPDKRI